MGKAKGSQRLDKYYRLAKETGYRSRASFKLLQLDARYKFLNSARAVLDLCAAPGGWMQVAVQKGPVASLVLGVDLAPIRPMQGAVSLIADITTTQCRAAVRRVLEEHGAKAFDVILHDGSPNVGGAWSQEATTQSVLVIQSVRMATEFLAPRGTFVTKVFRSQDYTAILFCLKQLFEKVEATKPAASRSSSAEIYVIAQRYKAPAKIDPHLLNVKYLFQGALDRPKVKDVLHPEKQKRHRDGYEEGNPTLWKEGTAADFIWSDSPLEYLGTVNAISFDNPASLLIKNHEITTDEVKSLCEDLFVLDRNSFKHLLKWRIRVRNVLFSSKEAATKEASAEKTEKPKPDEDENLLHEMEELTNIIDRNTKKARKKASKRRQKDKARTATGMQKDATGDDYVDPSLFSLSSIKGRKELQAVETTELNEDSDLSESEDIHGQRDEPLQEVDSDEEQSRYHQQLEDLIDVAYEQYVTRKGGGLKQGRKRLRRANPDADTDLLEEGEEDENPMEMDQESDKDQEEEETNPLMVPLDTGIKPTKEQVAEMWFSQDIFTDSGGAVGPTEKSDSDEEMVEKLKPTTKPKEKTKSVNTSITNLEIGDTTASKKKNSKEKDDFEIVPQEPPKSAHGSDSDSDSDSSSDDDDLDDNTKAEVLAYAKKMLRKKQREQILDDAYGKYMFDDEGLPVWFLEEEKSHRQPNKPITKEEVEAMKAQFREIDTRPSKKVAQAKARKKRAELKQLDKARKKADSISDQTDISELSKRKMINRLYRKAAPKKPEKEYVVAKKGVRVKVGKGKVLVDPRMKKDKRANAAGAKGKKGKGKQGKGKGMKGGAAKGKGGVKGGGAPMGKGKGRGKGRK